MTGETLSNSAYRQLKEQILDGRVTAESVLSERGLSEDLGISRTPLRTAISRLEQEGLIDRLQNGVILVRSVNVEQLLEIVKLRQKLESAAAARAAEFGMTEELEAIRSEMQAIVEASDTTFDAFWGADERFHMEVARAARLSLLPRILEEQRAIARRCTLTRTYDTFTDQAREHIEIIDAIERHDPDSARNAMSRHFDHVKQRFLSTFSRG
ncbi:GntR family transcriptional regulator [Tropicimonas sp. IMCC6043]|uniref:GntR family transcriptional regulator n=1 Tax=Tropicimonas sp. IMCC6043 TaxID=2510645 RepID=UPI00101D2A6A|nr:GntR family transcriptional regulator [Tropicimonas sp. IMCC6043]RYH06083.1 GntR family transcriptional regulator [Tropicimonas sp. IMCC6043]